VTIAAVLLIALTASLTKEAPTPDSLLQRDNDLINAITDPNIESLQVPDKGFIKLSMEVWVDQIPLVLKKNLKIRGSWVYTTLNIIYVIPRLQIRPSLMLTFIQIKIERARCASNLHANSSCDIIDIFKRSFASTLPLPTARRSFLNFT
jgi:hypothetical protein